MLIASNIWAVFLLGFPAIAHAAASCLVLSSVSSFSSPKLPNPFVFANGSRVTTTEHWRCRREEIKTLLQQYELGSLPPNPRSLTASMPNINTIRVEISYSGRSIALHANVIYPSGAGPFPAILAIGNLSIPQPSGVAIIQFDPEDMAKPEARGQGKFYTLYGTTITTGALLAWAWSASRIIDALEVIPLSASLIDPKKIGITGCAGHGRAALVAGGFDERFKLTIPQDAGTGATACWRITDEIKRNGSIRVETASDLMSGRDAPSLSQAFAHYSTNLNQLPYDNHMLMGLHSPRGLFVTENSIHPRHAPMSAYGCAVVARPMFQVLGSTSSFAFSQIAHRGGQCSFQSSNQQFLDSFVARFLKGNERDNSVIFSTDQHVEDFDVKRWVDWRPPSHLEDLTTTRTLTLTAPAPTGPH